VATRLAESFVRAGFAEDDAQTRTVLVERAGEACRVAFDGPAAWRWFVPGRIEIFGKHTDYAGGRSLLATVPRGIAFAARPRTDAVVRVLDAQGGRTVEVMAGGPEDNAGEGLRNYLHVVAQRLARNFPGSALGVDIAIASDLPRAAGLSSSSALVVGLAAVLARRASLAERAEWRREITTPADLATYLSGVENGYDFGSLKGTSGVGTLGGSEDHTAILACRPGLVSQFRFAPVRHLGDAAMPDAWAFVIATSGVQADKAGGARDDYNRASRGSRALLDIWNAHAARPAATLGDALGQDGTAMPRLEHWISTPSAAAFTPAELHRRLRHFVAEDQRVADALPAFTARDAEAVGRLAEASQRDAEALLGNQVAETRSLAALARQVGSWGACSFGAGFGGSVWALVPRRDADRFGREWMAAYIATTGAGPSLECFAARPGPPIIDLADLE